MISYLKNTKNRTIPPPSITTGVVALISSFALAGNAAGFEFDKDGDNLVGYKGTVVEIRGGYFIPTNSADLDEPAMSFTHPETGEVTETELIDDTFIYSIFTDNQFTWGSVDLRYGSGLKDGANRDGQLFRSSIYINTPWQVLKLYGNYAHQYFVNGRHESHIRYGIGLGAPILNGQLLKGYLAKRYTDVTSGGHQLFEGDNGYVLGLKTDYKFNKNWAYHFIGEYAWDKKFTEVTQEAYPGPSFLPIYDLSAENLRKTSYKMSHSITYRVTDGFDVGVEYLLMKGEGILLKNPGSFGAFIQYAF
ncbi:hypothetical protein [Photobacterium sagamiensis]|uniref:hypothetical protein n=1 Tax=Photobacterium sagamiensis TaxID=2910241 RepID=UPI003D0ED3B9